MAEFCWLWRQECRSLFYDKAILLTLFGGVFFYAWLYPLPYANQVTRELPVVLVDEDGSALARRLAFMADATPQLQLVAQVATLQEAEQAIRRGEARGLLLIPRHFYRDVLLGRTVTLGFAGDAAYYLMYGAIAEGLSLAANTVGAQVRIQRLLAQGKSVPGALAQWRPFATNIQPVFNPTLGYQQYVVSGVFLLILHQTLLIGAGLLGATQNETKNRGGYWQQASPALLLLVRTLLLMLVYLGFTLFYLGPCLYGYGLSHLAEPLQLLGFLLPFFLATTQLGILYGVWLPRRELATPIIILSSLPLVFVAGFIWPAAMLPELLQWLTHLLPAPAGIMGLLKLNTMGADWAAVAPSWWGLWGLTVVYGALAWWSLCCRVCRSSASK
jgi:ABC-2 type transport system permease protein